MKVDKKTVAEEIEVKRLEIIETTTYTITLSEEEGSMLAAVVGSAVAWDDNGELGKLCEQLWMNLPDASTCLDYDSDRGLFVECDE